MRLRLVLDILKHRGDYHVGFLVHIWTKRGLLDLLAQMARFNTQAQIHYMDKSTVSHLLIFEFTCFQHLCSLHLETFVKNGLFELAHRI